MAGHDQRGDLEHPLPADMKCILIGAQPIVVRSLSIPPKMGEGDQLVSGPHHGGDVLGGMPRGLPECHVGRYLKALGRPVVPSVALVDGPMVVNPGVGKQRDVDRVIRVVV